MRCQARVEDMLCTFPNTETAYHTTKQCEEVASHKYSVDDGDSEMLLCGGCFRRCLTKKSGGSWLGFFDCSYPPDAKVKGSRWYFWTLSNSASTPVEEEEEAEEEEEEEEAEEAEEEVLCDEMAKCSLSREEEEAEEEVLCDEMAKCSLSREEDKKALVADQINARIASLQALVKASRNMPVKEQAKILKEIINLRTELKKNK